jgi:hypothetical protein
MTKRTLSSGQKWKGFQPKAYFLSTRAEALPIIEIIGGTEKVTTVGDAFRDVCFEGPALRHSKTLGEFDSDIHSLDVKTDSGDRRFKGSSFAIDLLKAFLRLHKAGFNPHETEWYLYDCSYALDDIGERYEFFVVCRNEILEEDIAFFDRPHSGFDPSVFEDSAEIQPMWSGDNGFEKVQAALWYRKFYTETKIGRLMVLRPDKPTLYFYPEGHQLNQPGLGGIATSLASIDRRLRQVLIVLVLAAMAVLALIALRLFVKFSP